MDLVLNNLQGLICHKNQPTNQQFWTDLFVFLTMSDLFTLHIFTHTYINIYTNTHTHTHTHTYIYIYIYNGDIH